MTTTETTRTARCSYFKSCGAEVASEIARKDRAFFQDKSAPQNSCAHPGTNARGECGYAQVAHEYSEERVHKAPVKTHPFVAQTEGWAHDEYYCGCRGWD